MAMMLRGAVLIDGTGADPRPADVALDGGRIVEVRGDIASGGVSLDLDGLTLLPGLIDAHSHFGLIGATNDVPAALIAARIFRNAELALDAGFTTVRDVGGIDGGVATAVREGLVRGPRIMPSGPIICRTGGHGDSSPVFAAVPTPADVGLPGLTKRAQPCDGVAEIRSAVRSALRRGATQIKVAVTGGFSDFHPGVNEVELALDELVAAVAEADAAATYVTAHAHHSHGIRHGLSAGVSCFEHGTFLDADTAAAMAAAGAHLVPTLAVVHLLTEATGLSEDVVSRARLFEHSMAESLLMARDAGVTVGSGSDITGVEQNRRGLELTLRAGVVGTIEAVHMATGSNAAILRRSDRLGTVEPGKLADLIAIDGDPVSEPELFDDPDRVVLVIKDGVVVKDRISQQSRPTR